MAEKKPRQAKKVRIGELEIGRGVPVRVESMLKNPLEDMAAVAEEIEKLENVGCELVRVAFPSRELVPNLEKLLRLTKIAVMVDVHFDFGLAIEATRCGARSVRINPGNMENRKGLKKLVEAANKEKVVLRIGANSGSLPDHVVQRFPKDGGAALAEAVTRQVEVVQDEGFTDLILSAKSTEIEETLRANIFLAQRFDYPLHIGITEAGCGMRGIVKSSCGLARLLSQGIGDTLRVSLTGSSDEEVLLGQMILQQMRIRRFGPDLISCPGCGRKRVDVGKLVGLAERYMERMPGHWTVAVMGCEVNGPREAAHADFGIAGTAGGVVFFSFGRVIGRCDFEKAEETMVELLESVLDDEKTCKP